MKVYDLPTRSIADSTRLNNLPQNTTTGKNWYIWW